MTEWSAAISVTVFAVFDTPVCNYEPRQWLQPLTSYIQLIAALGNGRE